MLSCRGARRAATAAAALLWSAASHCGEAAGPETEVRWSRIVFQSDRSGDHEIMTMDTLGGSVVNLTSTPGVQRHPAWSPDHRFIAFVAEDTAYGLRIMNADGSGAWTVPETSGADLYPKWSPDGRRIALADIRGAVRTVRPDSTASVEVFAGPASGAIWLDGERLAFSYAPRDEQYSAIFSIRLDGTQLTQLTSPSPSSYDQQAARSPDGSALAFVRIRSSSQFSVQRLYIRDATGAERPVTYFPDGADWTPAWSPDGTRIVFAHEVSEQYDFYMVSPDGTGLVRITTNGGIQLSPSW